MRLRSQVIEIGPHHQVDLTGLQRRLSLACIDHPQLDAVGVAEDAAGDLAGDVDVEALQLPGGRVPEAEQIRVLVDTDDEPTTLGDRRHRRTRWHRTRRRQRAGTQAGFPIAVRIRGSRRGRDFLRTGWPRFDGRDRHRRRRSGGSTSRDGERNGEQRHHNSGSHRNSLSRGHNPTTAAAAATTISTSVPVGLHASHAPAADDSIAQRVARSLDPVAQAGFDGGELRCRGGRIGADCLGDRGGVVAALVDLGLLSVAGGPFLHRVRRGRRCRVEQCAQLVDVAVERLLSCGDVATRDQLQGLVGSGLLGEDASLRKLFEPRGALGSAVLDRRPPPSGLPRRSIRSPPTPRPPRRRAPY